MDFLVPEPILHRFLKVAEATTLEQSFEILTEATKSATVRTDLASCGFIFTVLQFCQYLDNRLHREFIILSLRLLRNLCAGEITNQNLFLKENGPMIVHTFMKHARESYDPDFLTVRLSLQVLANVSLAGDEHKVSIWGILFPDEFLAVARMQCLDTCDPLCMIICSCIGTGELLVRLCSDTGLCITAEIVRTASKVGFKEEWLMIILTRICFEESCCYQLFCSLTGTQKISHSAIFSPQCEHVYLLRVISEMANQRIKEIHISYNFALSVFEIFKRSLEFIAPDMACESALPTGNDAIDVHGYSLTIMRDLCAQDSLTHKEEDPVTALLSAGLIENLLSLLHQLENPSLIRKAMEQDKDQRNTGCSLPRPCMYHGYRRDIVAVIGNCAHGRKQVQDEIRQRSGIFLLMQQCVVDEQNPFLREWGIWCLRNLLEGNEENQRVVAELELQGPGNVQEISQLGLKVEVDPKTHLAKLVNV